MSELDDAVREVLEEATHEYTAEQLANAKEETLKWVNMIREEYGAEALVALPRAERYISNACVVAEALAPAVLDGSKDPDYKAAPRYSVVGKGFYFVREGQTQTRPVPAAVNTFALLFDAGYYPELEK